MKLKLGEKVIVIDCFAHSFKKSQIVTFTGMHKNNKNLYWFKDKNDHFQCLQSFQFILSTPASIVLYSGDKE